MKPNPVILRLWMLDMDHKDDVDVGIRDFADGAVGCDWWDCDE